LSRIKNLFKFDRKTLREALLGEEFFDDDPDRPTTITIRVQTKLRLQKWIPKGLTYDKGLNRILDFLESHADKAI